MGLNSSSESRSSAVDCFYIRRNTVPGGRSSIYFSHTPNCSVLATSPLKSGLWQTAVTAVLRLLRRREQSFVDCYGGRSSSRSTICLYTAQNPQHF